MKFECKKLFSFSTESLGQLDCFPLSLGNMKVFYQRKMDSDKEISNKLIRILISVTCHPHGRVTEETFTPNPSLSVIDIASLKETEIEEFSRLFIEANPDLYRKKITHTKASDKGTIITSELGDIEISKDEGETNTEYLERLIIQYEDKISTFFKNKFGELSKHYQSLQGFSNGLKKQINSTFKMGMDLKNSIESIKPAQAKVSFVPEINNTAISEVLKIAEENRLRPFQEISQRLDKLIELSMDSGDFLVEMNRTQTTIAEELKISSDKTYYFSKWNLLIGVIIIALTVISLIVTVYSIKTSSTSSDALTQSIGKYTTTLEKVFLINESKNPREIKEGLDKMIDQQGRILLELQNIQKSLVVKPVQPDPLPREK